MNKVILVGRLTKDPELRATASGVSVCSFTVACDRRFVKQGEERQSDFINCVAWQKSAEAIARYFQKGNRIALEGSLQVRSWEGQDGQKHYATEVIVDQWEFAQSKSESGTNPPGATKFENSKSAMDKENLGVDLDEFIPIDNLDLPF